MALLGSASSSIVGFSIMGFAPMPMFASYGQLTAVMIAFALISSLIVLPSLLMIITRE
jgi:predicted RND superfamily exporter protein